MPLSTKQQQTNATATATTVLQPLYITTC